MKMGIKSYREGDDPQLLLNWGSTKPIRCYPEVVLNSPAKVIIHSNKKLFFKNYFPNGVSLHLHPDIQCVPWTTSQNKAADWTTQGHQVFGRLKLASHSGKGIILCRTPEDVFNIKCELYTRYIPKKLEFRAHFAFGKVFHWQRKAMRKDRHYVPGDFLIRNWDHGFVFVSNELIIPEVVTEAAVTFAEISDIRFGAIDIIYTAATNKARILEVNTAPGIEGKTVDLYSEVFLSYIASL
jgi:hypothetical protein